MADHVFSVFGVPIHTGVLEDYILQPIFHYNGLPNMNEAEAGESKAH